MKTNWNDGIDYSFSAIKSLMWILGLWPLQNDATHTIRWFMTFTAGSCGVPRDGLENLSCDRIYAKKITIIMNSAIDDWSSVSLTKESRLTMMAYARIERLVSLTNLILGGVAFVLFFGAVFLSNKPKVATNDTAWNFVFPSTCLYKGVSYSMFKALFVIQVIQGAIVLMSECSYDSFFFNIVMHLCGQLELLRIQFLEFNQKRNDKTHNGNILRPLVKRHCHLIALTKNIEDAFNINILLRLLIISIVIAASGIGVILSLKNHDYKEMMKMLVSIQFYMIQTLLYTYAGDTLQSQSEAIIHAIYNSTWHELPPVW